ncbi:metallophosphoesterase [Caldalkalibacillus thermarum TA2.A1]|uniref:Metallophosphoesterase n=1 Tax=Caldalkalibacillus thermarum (strain TA2.A1) TaxID=986075 RepID=F5L956_CALTT|nr:metallophosphoesterase [Caldalkalibacillus thermarum]EGL82130.1 metallophosphoesterase [Caldalkalibacillus thermarum TA2.A1]QZT34957.1 metallophosphoesterase [Caldalkalibacillus thermarum TA2.A1]
MLLTSALTLGGLCLLSKGYWNTFHPEVKHIRLKTVHNFGAKQMRILHLSDIHIEKLSVTPEKVIQLAGKETYDFIALTGDYLDKVKSIDPFIQFLKGITQIPTRFGIYAVWGNHDWVIGPHLPRLKQKMESLGVTVLCNESVTTRHSGGQLHIIGIDDHHSGHSNVEQAFQDVPENGFRLVLTHDPLIVNHMPYPFDYLLCGHLHSGQIYYPLPLHSLTWGIKPFRKHLCGLHRSRQGTYYISGGLGQTGANLRIGCRPEITIHHIEQVSQSNQAAADERVAHAG